MRVILFCFIFFFLSIGFVSALNIEPLKENYKTGDTFQADIGVPGIVNKFTADNFELVFDGEKVNIGVFFVQVDREHYFVYFALPQQAGNYTFLIKNYDVIEQDILKQKTDNYSFVVNQGNGVRVDPGIVDARADWDLFYVRINNTGNESLNFNIASDVNFINIDERSQNISLYPGASIELTFFIIKNKIDRERGNILFLDYKVPFLVSFKSKEEIPYDVIRFIDERINLTINEDDSLDGDVSFRNFYHEAISNISFRLSDQLKNVVSIEPYAFDSIDPGEIKKVHVWVNKDKIAKPGDYSGNLTLISGNIRDGFPIFLKITKEEINIPINQSFVEPKNISEKKNITQPILPTETGKSYKWIWAVVILVIVLIGIFIFYFLRKKEKLENVSDLVK